MVKTKGFILLHVLIALVVGAGMLAMLYLLLAQAYFYHARALQWFAAADYAVTTLNYACTHQGAAFQKQKDFLQTAISKRMIGSTVYYTVRVLWTGPHREESFIVQQAACQKAREHD